MKTLSTFLFFALLTTYNNQAQVGIGTISPNASLDIQSSNVVSPANNDGLLIPKVDEFPATSPTVAQDGMLVYATGNGSVAKGFYYWNNSGALWEQLAGNSVDQVNDLFDGKADPTGSSVFIGTNAGLNDDNTNNFNTAMGFEALMETTTGGGNSAMGYQSLNLNTTGIANTAHGTWSMRDNTTGQFNTALGLHALLVNTTGNANTAVGAHAIRDNTTGLGNTALGQLALQDNTTGSDNVALGFNAGALTVGDNNVFIGRDAGSNGSDTKSGSVFIGYQAGYDESDSNRLYIENSSSTSALIYGEFDTDLLRINGDLEAYKPSNSAVKVRSNSGNQSSLKLFEAGDYGFEFEYDGSPDKLYLWSRTFAGNEGIRMTWLKDGRVGIGTTSPYAKLDIEASNAASPVNTDGLLVPRIDAFPSTNPGANQNGMLVFLNTDNSFYYWNNTTTSWVNIVNAATAVERVNDLVDGKSDNDGSQDGSSLFLGVSAGANDDLSDNDNVGVGYFALRSNTTGYLNTAVGSMALESNTIGVANTAVGEDNLTSNTTGRYNTAVGTKALEDNTTAWHNSAVGFNSLRNNITGASNSAFGAWSLTDNTSGLENVAVGWSSLYINSTGDHNTAVGSDALYSNTTGDNNTAIGHATSLGNNYSNTTAIGYNADPNSSNQVRIGNASVTVIGGFANWSVFSDRRVKTNIREDIAGLDFIKRLRPVSYNYDMDAIARFEKTPDSLRLQSAEVLKAMEVQTGFIAQEVEAAALAAGFDFHGVIKPERPDQPYALRYSEFVVPMVKAMQEQQTTIEELEDEVATLKNEIRQIKALLNKD